MKAELSSLDLHFLLKELDYVKSAKINKVFGIDEKVLFQLRATGEEKKYLQASLPSMLFMSDVKEEMENSDNFSLSLRKHILNTRIKDISQIDFERIVKISLDAKEKELFLYIELFRPGNIILCDSDNKILMAKKYKGFGSRLIRPRIEYKHPVRDINFLDIDEKKLEDLLKKSERDSIVITLAVDLGLGGNYAEELCLMANIDKNKQQLDLSEKKRLLAACHKLRDMKTDAIAYFEDKEISAVSPFELKIFKEKKSEPLDSFNTGLILLDSVLPKQADAKQMKSKKEAEKINAIIKKQELQAKGFEKASKENQRKGELLYENYPLAQHILSEFKKELKSLSLKELKQKIKKDSLIKDIDEKEKKITIELAE